MPPDLTRDPGGRPDLLAPFGPGPWTVLPTELAVATTTDGRPELLLELVRPERPVPGRDDAYSMLDIRLDLVHRLEEGLAGARAVDPAASVVPATLGRGWLRFAASKDVEVPEELTRPVALGARGLTGVRWTMRLSLTAGLLLRELLEAGAVSLGAVAQFDLTGMAPRVPLRVRAERDALRARVGELGAPVALGDLRAELASDAAALGIEVLGDGDAVDPQVRADALCDLVVAELGAPGPGPAGPVLELRNATGGPIDRDLRDAFVATRPLVLALEPLAAARALGSVDGLVHETVSRRFAAGVRPLRVLANLPSCRVGLAAIGARVTKEPAPPARVRAVGTAVRFTEPADEGAATLLLAPLEATDVDVEPFAVVRTAAGGRELRGTALREAGGVAVLSPEAFPVRFVRLGASPALLGLASVAGRCVYAEGSVDVELTPAAPACSVALAPESGDARFELELHGTGGEPALALAPMPARDLTLDLADVPEYGRHEILVRCVFADGDTAHEIDMIPDGAPPERAQVVAFTPARPERTISWFAPSPFRPGIRHRPHARGNAQAPWSEPHGPFEPLVVNSEVAS